MSAELLSRFDREAKWTAHVGDLKITGDSPAPAESWDGADLFAALTDLVEAGVISIDAVNAAVQVETVYKPRKAGLTALRRLGGRAAEVVDALAQSVEKDRRVTVSSR